MGFRENINKQRPFNTLLQGEKLKVLFYRGENLAELKRKNVTILLFKLDNFFVDVYKSNLNNDVMQIRSFDSTKGLYKYQLTNWELGKRIIRIEGGSLENQ